MNNNSDMLGKEPISKLLVRLAFPAILAQLINMLYNLVDRIYLGHIPDIGDLALTGVGVCLPVILVVSAFAALVSMGGAPRASIFMGKGDYESAEKVVGNSFVLLIIVSVVLTLILTIWNEPLLYMFGASSETIGYATQYLFIYSLGTIFVQMSLGMNAFIGAQGFAKISMCTVLIGAISNIILDPIFIFGLDMGVQGAALATIISQGISAVWVIKFLSGKKTTLKIKIKSMRLDPKIFLPCIAIGLAPFIMQITESILLISFNSSLQKYGGDIAVGSMTIMMSVFQLTMLPLLGLGQGAQPIISFNYGARNALRVRTTFKYLLGMCVGYSTFMWILVMSVPQVFAKIFTSSPELINYTTSALRVYAAGLGMMGINTACQMTLVAMGKAKASVFIAILRKIILLIPLIYILPMIMTDQASAVILAEPIADIVSVLITIVLFVVVFKKAMDSLINKKNDLQGEIDIPILVE